MPTPAERRRNNIRAGIFVSIALLLAVSVIVVVSGIWETVSRRTRSYSVRFPVSAGVQNLLSGAEVHVGGVVMGHVSEILPLVSPGEAFREIDVGFELSEEVELFDGAVVQVRAPILGTGAWVDIQDVGDPAAGPPPGGLIQGAPSAGLLDSVLGVENAARTSQILESSSQFTDFLAKAGDERIGPILDDMKTTTTDARELVGRIRAEDWPRWARSLDEVTAWANGFTSALDSTLAESHDLIRDGRAIIGENRPQIDSIVDNMDVASADVRAVAERLRTETVDRVNAMLGAGQEALESALATINDIGTDYASWSVDLGETLGNAQLASQQLKLATIEVRRSPWKLLYKPSDQEVAHELLYDAARSFALATADLKAAAASANALMDRHGDQLAGDPELLERVQRNLIGPLRNYEEAQTRLLDVLIGE